MISNAQAIWTGTTVGISVLPEGVALIVFDNKNKRVNILSSSVLDELTRALDELDQLKGIAGVVFLSGKEDSFIVGADINEIAQAQNMPWEVAYRASVRGKAIFDRIANMSIHTVAAINGRCLGGGAELTLACRKRLATDSENTVIGLPEVGLGVIPGWGGTVRATKLMGLKLALPLVLDPMRPLRPRSAWRGSLVSEVVPVADLLPRAIAVATGARTRDYRPSAVERLTRAVEDSHFGRHVIQIFADKMIVKKTKGKYPAPHAAVEVMVRSLGTTPEKAFDIESLTFAKLVQTPESKELVQAFMVRK